MQYAHYSVIKYVSDFARNEPVNIGIVAWFDGNVEIRFSEQAFARVLAATPDFAPDAFDGYAHYIRQRLIVNWPKNDDDAHRFLCHCVRGAEVVTDAFKTAINEDLPIPMALAENVDRLMQRLVEVTPREAANA